MRHGGKEDLAGEPLHFFERVLDLAPVGNRCAQPFILFPGERHAHSLAFDFAGPLVTGTPRPRAAVLNIALADPSHRAQSAAELLELLLAPEIGFGNGLHKEKSSVSVNKAVYIPL